MIRSGSVDVTAEQTQAESPEAKRRLPWIIIIPGIAAVCLAGFIISQVAGVLYAIILPPSPPLPDNAVMGRHRAVEYGVDEWTYSTEQDACEVAAFYQQNGGTCQISHSLCGGEAADEALILPGDVAYCSAVVPFSIFEMQWETRISRNPVRFSVSREILWSGGAAPTPSAD